MHRALLAALAVALVLLAAGDGRARHGLTSIFTGDFESGSYVPWAAPQCSNYGYSLGQGGAIAAFGPFYADRPGLTHAGDTVPAGQGAFFAELGVPADPAHKQRCQVIVRRTVDANTDDYYSLMVYVPVGWSPGTPAWGPVIAELDYQTWSPGGAKNLALTLRPDHVTLAMTVGPVRPTQPYYTYVSDADAPATCRGGIPCALYAIPPGSFRQGVWNELVIHDHWTTDPAHGLVEAWHREKGQTAWTRSVHLAGYPTLQSDATHPSPGDATLDVLSNYRAPAATAETVYVDGFSRASSFAAAAAELP